MPGGGTLRLLAVISGLERVGTHYPAQVVIIVVIINIIIINLFILRTRQHNI